jgi:hypothetical protein
MRIISDILPIDAIEEVKKKARKKKNIRKSIKKYKCEICDKEIKKKNINNHMKSKAHKKISLQHEGYDPMTGLEIKLLKSSFYTTFVSFIIKNNFYKDIDKFLNACDMLIKSKIEFYIKKHKGIKINM